MISVEKNNCEYNSINYVAINFKRTKKLKTDFISNILFYHLVDPLTSKMLTQVTLVVLTGAWHFIYTRINRGDKCDRLCTHVYYTWHITSVINTH